jgi:bifunctional DNase/RNase
MSDIPVSVWQLVRDEEGHDVVLLRDEQGRVLPILIGVCEAAAIWVVLAAEQAKPFVRRPWSHDLMRDMIEQLGARLDRVVIDGFINDHFLATLHLMHREGEVVVDVRPSDAIALLLRVSAPLFVNNEVWDELSVLPEQDGDEGEDLPDFGGELP